MPLLNAKISFMQWIYKNPILIKFIETVVIKNMYGLSVKKNIG